MPGKFQPYPHPKKIPSLRSIIDVTELPPVPARDTDHARRMADLYRKGVDAQNSTTLKLAYFRGVLDWAAMMEAEGETVTDSEKSIATR